MILTKDNLLRYIRKNKAVTPTIVAESFETTTTIASAALSELAKEKLVAITYLKLSSSPYYYDPNQNSVLIELGEKHLTKNEKDIFHKLQQNQILSENSLTIPQRLAINNIKDFACPLEINYGEKQLKFWVWYQRDLSQTKSQILEALNSSNNNNSNTQNTPQKNIQEQTNKEKQKPTNNQQNQPQQIQQNTKNQQNSNSYANKQTPNNDNSNQSQNKQENLKAYQNQELPLKAEQNEKENFIENYLKANYLTIESKQKDDKGIEYKTSLKLPQMTIEIECYYFYKKPTETQLIKFYTTSLKPKIIFIEKCPKKILKLNENLENLKIINI
jgi:flagellar biosynthesis GTPase FlhF